MIGYVPFQPEHFPEVPGFVAYCCKETYVNSSWFFIFGPNPWTEFCQN